MRTYARIYARMCAYIRAYIRAYMSLCYSFQQASLLDKQNKRQVSTRNLLIVFIHRILHVVFTVQFTAVNNSPGQRIILLVVFAVFE